MRVGQGARVLQYVAQAAILPTDNLARVTRYALEVAYTYTAPSPTTPTGSGVTRYALEAAILPTDNLARVTRYALEVAYVDTTPDIGGGASPTGGQVGYGSIS